MNTKYLSLLIAGATAFGCTEDPAVEIPASPGSELQIEVGGPNQPNQVFVDLSFDQQTAIDRASWDLGFAGSSSAVILNASSEMMAREIPKGSISEVEAADFEGFYDQTTVDGIFSYLFAPPPYPEWFSESENWIDDPSGDLSKTAIDLSSGNVYFVNRGFTPEGEARGSYLVKITDTGNGYQMEYRSTNSSESQSTTISKSETNYAYFNFDDGEVSVAPDIAMWDIAFTTYMEKLEVGPGTRIPYRFLDYVMQGSSTQTATIETEAEGDILAAYEAFGSSDLASLTFSTDLNSIGASWRTVASPTPGSVTGVREDRFYVIKDASGNNYKLLFTQMLNSDGERGYPQIVYELVN